MDYKIAWEQLKMEVAAKEEYKGFLDLMKKYEPIYLYFPMHDLNEKNRPWFIVYAQKIAEDWSVSFLTIGFSQCPERYKSIKDIPNSLKHNDTYKECIMQTNGCPSKEELIAFAKQIYEKEFI